MFSADASMMDLVTGSVKFWLGTGAGRSLLGQEHLGVLLWQQPCRSIGSSGVRRPLPHLPRPTQCACTTSYLSEGMKGKECNLAQVMVELGTELIIPCVKHARRSLLGANAQGDADMCFKRLQVCDSMRNLPDIGDARNLIPADITTLAQQKVPAPLVSRTHLTICKIVSMISGFQNHQIIGSLRTA